MKEIEELIDNIKRELTEQYPFLAKWQVSFDNAKRRAGVCRVSTKEISLSKHHISNNSIDVIKDTILHEFAHAIAYEIYSESGHGIHWKKIATRLGAIPRARGHFNVPTAPWLLVHSCSETSVINPISERFRINKKIKNYFLLGRPETKGELFFLKQIEYQQYKLGLLDKNRLKLVQ